MSTNTNTNTNTETNQIKELSDDVKNTDTNIKPDTSMTATLNITSYEKQTVIVPEENEEGTDHNVIFTSDEEDNIFDDVVEEDTMAYYDSNNELQIVGETRGTFYFNPLTRSSREEVGPLVQITKFTDIPYTHIGQELKGLPRFREKMKGDGSCYFRAISFAVSGTQEYYKNVRTTICDYIENFPGRLNAVLKNAHDVQSGYEYIKKSKMHKDNTWATKIKILATAKCFRRDIFTFYNYKWQRYSYLKTLSTDAIYLDNRAGNHFDVVLTQ